MVHVCVFTTECKQTFCAKPCNIALLLTFMYAVQLLNLTHLNTTDIGRLQVLYFVSDINWCREGNKIVEKFSALRLISTKDLRQCTMLVDMLVSIVLFESVLTAFDEINKTPILQCQNCCAGTCCLLHNLRFHS